MNLESQVCSLNLARKLKELGVRQESAFYWVEGWNTNEPPLPSEYFMHLVDKGEANNWTQGGVFAAFTVAELGEMLPKSYASIRMLESESWFCYRYHPSQIYGSTQADAESDARAKMLTHLIEKGIVKP